MPKSIDEKIIVPLPLHQNMFLRAFRTYNLFSLARVKYHKLENRTSENAHLFHNCFIFSFPVAVDAVQYASTPEELEVPFSREGVY